MMISHHTNHYGQQPDELPQHQSISANNPISSYSFEQSQMSLQGTDHCE